MAIERGIRAQQRLRPASLLMAGAVMPCAIGNLVFGQKLKMDGGGWENSARLFLTMLRSDLPQIPNPAAPGTTKPLEFKRGAHCQVRNDDPECAVPGETKPFTIGQENQLTATVVMIAVEQVAV